MMQPVALRFSRHATGSVGRSKRAFVLLTLMAALLGSVVVAHPVAAIDTVAREMILVDVTTGTVLAEKNPNDPMPPSSMSKLMTLYVVFELLRDGKLRMTDSFGVSEKAWRTPGSEMFLPLDGKATVEELLRGVIIQSGNDACVVLAEGIAGDEGKFAALLNERAAAIGLKHSHFVNASGLPEPNHYMTASDLAILAYRLINDFPQFYPWFSEKTYTYNKISQGNRNPLLYSYPGADGLKTGHAEEAGYGLTASAQRDGRRLILVANGMKDMNERADEAERLLDYGFNEFDNYKLFKAGEAVDQIPVWLGESDVVAAVAPADIVVTLPKRARKDMKVHLVAPGPAAAPVAKDAEVARLVINAPEFGPIEHRLVAGEAVDKVSGFGRIGSSLRRLFSGG
jgi:D-alanyl-D-alanine carboxypeptidase (penicillin-binding protein 5/6)